MKRINPAKTRTQSIDAARHDYDSVLTGMVGLLEQARRFSARAINAVMTATYWEIGRRIVEFEQGGAQRAGYGDELLKRLSVDLSTRFGRGFGVVNLSYMKRFFLNWPPTAIFQTPSEKWCIPGNHLPRKSQTLSDEFNSVSLRAIATRFPLPWSHYVLLLRGLRSREAMEFYQAEALRGGWSVRQLQRQMDSRFYERTAMSRNKTAMLSRAAKAVSEVKVTADDEIHDPLILEFLGFKDEYSESDLEEALIRHLEAFLLELGNDFAFVGRQRRLRIDDEWFRVDLLFFHRRLRCLVIIDLKLGRFTHADAGQMHMYLNYAREHWTESGENPPVGIILCAGKGDALVRYATEGLPNKMIVREYLMALPKEKTLATEIRKTRTQLEKRLTTNNKKVKE
jgi:predicted nuclease of restriction endonuclease-like (RecB) superfamily